MFKKKKTKKPTKDSKTAKEKKAAFKRKYQESYLNYRFTATGDSHSPSLLCIICGDQLSNEAMKHSELLHHMETKHPALKDKPLEFFELQRKKHEHEEQKQLLKATTSSNVSALRASFLVANCIAKAKKPFTVGAESILPAAKDICRELLGDAAVQKVARVPLSASTITRRIDEIAGDTEAQLLERINESPWYAIQVNQSIDVDNKATTLVFVRYIFQEDAREAMLCAFCCQPTPHLQNCSSL